MKINYCIIIIVLLMGCDYVPEKVSMDNSKIQPLLKAAASFDRTSFGFTPIPDKADVRFESKARKRYDAMLHIYSKTSRTISFKKTPSGFKWIGEQEIFQGSKQYKTVDGIFYENICLTYDIEEVTGYPTNKMNIIYSGEDPRLVNRGNLTLADIQPILKEWNY